MGMTTKAPDQDTTYERLDDESDEAWKAFCFYRDAGPRTPGKWKNTGRSIENVRKAMGYPDKSIKNLNRWSTRYNWVQRARLYDDELERLNRKAVERKIPYWAQQRERSHKLNMRIARDIRKKLRAMLEHPLNVEEVRDYNGREVVFLIPAKWNYSTVGNLAKIAAELESGTIADAMLMDSEAETFDVQSASIEELRDYITRHTGKKPTQESP
jgi:hypothetical protein